MEKLFHSLSEVSSYAQFLLSEQAQPYVYTGVFLITGVIVLMAYHKQINDVIFQNAKKKNEALKTLLEENKAGPVLLYKVFSKDVWPLSLGVTSLILSTVYMILLDERMVPDLFFYPKIAQPWILASVAFLAVYGLHMAVRNRLSTAKKLEKTPGVLVFKNQETYVIFGHYEKKLTEAANYYGGKVSREYIWYATQHWDPYGPIASRLRLFNPGDRVVVRFNKTCPDFFLVAWGISYRDYFWRELTDLK